MIEQRLAYLAKCNIIYEGSTDMFLDNSDLYESISINDIEEMDRDFQRLNLKSLQEKYEFKQTFSTCLKKDGTLRETVQIDPRLDLYYLTLTLMVGEKFESNRPGVVHSYRIKDSTDMEGEIMEGEIFRTDRNYFSYRDAINGILNSRTYLLTKGDYLYLPDWQDSDAIRNIKDVITLDISNFFSSITPGLLENSIAPYSKDCTRNILKILKLVGCKGLPVGGNASRILAEVTLAALDDFMRSEGYIYYRFVDDMTIFASEGEAESIIESVSSQLSKMNLTLNIEKTRVQRVEDVPTTENVVPSEYGYGFNLRRHLTKEIDIEDTLLNNVFFAYYRLTVKYNKPPDYIDTTIQESIYQLLDNPYLFVKRCIFFQNYWGAMNKKTKKMILETLKSILTTENNILSCGVNELCLNKMLKLKLS